MMIKSEVIESEKSVQGAHKSEKRRLSLNRLFVSRSPDRVAS